MVGARSGRRRGRLGSRTVAVGASLFVHFAIVAALILSAPRTPDQIEPPPLEVELGFAAPRPQPSSPARPAHARKTAASAAPAASAPAAAASSPAIAPVEAAPAPAQGSGAPTAGLSAALRSGLGCEHAEMLGLSAAERERCRDRLAGGRGIEDVAYDAISPEKRAEFDAAWAADHGPQHMAAIGCFARFGGGKIQWLHPSQGLKLGKLPCYVITPKSTFSADPPRARGW